jgi:hypothetical protein
MTISCATGQVSCPPAETTLIVALRAGRTDLRLRASALGNLYLGPAGVTHATGYNPQIGGADGVSEAGAIEYSVPIEDALYAYNAGPTAVTVQYMEIY